MQTPGNSRRSQRRTSEKLRNGVDGAKIGALLKEAIGKTLILQSCLVQYALLLNTVLPSDLDTPEMAELLLLAFSEMESLLQSSSDRQKGLTNTLTNLLRITPVNSSVDMFGGLGHFDLDGVYHHDS